MSVLACFLQSQFLHLLLTRRFTYLFFDHTMAVRSAAENFAAFAGQPPSFGKPVTEIFEALIGVEPVLEELYAGKLPTYRLEYIHYDSLSPDLYLTLHIHPLRQPQADGFLLIIEDVTAAALLEQKAVQARNELSLLQGQLNRLNQELHQQAFFDSLTGLPNRRSFEEFARRTLQLAIRRGAPLTLALLDIDDFKKINDASGHAVGDFCLKRLAESLRRSVRATDSIARYGGDEFCILFVDADSQKTQNLVERIQASIAEGELHQPHPVTTSIGIACFDAAAPSLESLLRRADHALYAAKRKGKNQVAIYSAVK